MKKFSMQSIKSGIKEAWNTYKQVYKDVKDGMSHSIKTFKRAKNNGRWLSDQEYRDNLAYNLRNLRSRWDVWKELAETLLMHEMLLNVWPKWDSKFLESLWKNRKVWKDVAKKLIENWNWQTVIKYIDKFKWLDKDIAKQLIEIKWENGDVTIENGIECVARNIDKFKWLDMEIVDILIEKGFGWSVAGNLESFEWLNHKEIAEKLIEKWNWWDVAYYLDKFEWLDKDIAKKLIMAWYGDMVAKNPERFWL